MNFLLKSLQVYLIPINYIMLDVQLGILGHKTRNKSAYTSMQRKSS